MTRLIDADALMDVIRQHEYRLATRQGSIYKSQEFERRTKRVGKTETR